MNNYEKFYGLAVILPKSDLLNAVCMALKELDSPEISKVFESQLRQEIRKAKDLANLPDRLLLEAHQAIEGHFLEKVYGDIIQAALELDKDYQFNGERIEMIISRACTYREHKSAGISWSDYVDNQGKMIHSIKIKAHKILLAAGFKKSTTTRGTEKGEPCRMVWRAPKIYNAMLVEDVILNFDQTMIAAVLRKRRKGIDEI